MFRGFTKKAMYEVFSPKQGGAKFNKFLRKQTIRKHISYPKISFLTFSFFIILQTVFSIYYIVINSSFPDQEKIFHGLVKGTVSILLIILWHLCLVFERKQAFKRSNNIELLITIIWTLSSMYLDILLFSDSEESFIQEATKYGSLRRGFQFFENFYAMTVLFKHKVSKLFYLLLATLAYAVITFIGGDPSSGVYFLFIAFFNTYLIFLEDRLYREEMHRYFCVRQEVKKNRNILVTLPESILILDTKGNVKFANTFMRNTFSFNGKDLDESFLNGFGNFSYREFSRDYSMKLSMSSVMMSLRTLKSKPSRKFTLTRKGTLINHAFDNLIESIKGIKSLQELVDFFANNTELWRKQDDFFFIFDTKYHHKETNLRLSIEVRASIFPHGDNNDLVILFRDTTERDKIAYLENDKIVYRNSLLASFSHELRTPLNANLAFIEQSIASPEVSKKAKENFLQPAIASSRLLLSLLNDILDFSQFISDKLVIKKYAASIKDTINHTMALFQGKVKAKGLKLLIAFDQSIPEPFNTDHQRVSQILVNLLSNAVKFTNSGSIQVSIEQVDEGAYDIAVADTGIGMTPEDLIRLRTSLCNEELKQRLNNHSSGIGIGLFISNVLTRRVTGRIDGIQVESTYGKGTKFSFTVENEETLDFSESCSIFHINEFMSNDDLSPMRVRDYKTDFNANKRKRASKVLSKMRTRSLAGLVGLRNEKVLLVDDEIFNILVLETFCKDLRLPTERAFNGKEAIEKIRELAKINVGVKVVLLDVNMPIMDGYETAVALNKMVEDGEIDDIIIIGVTAYVSPDMIEKCFDCGFMEVLNKPVSKDAIRGILKKYKIL